ncbi:TonB-dependent receptor domain-containing protein [Calditrichota bacterium]
MEPETVLDLELGASYAKADVLLKANMYWMSLHNEIVTQGGVNPNGFPVQDNVDRSEHMGVEIETAYRPVIGINAWVNMSLSSNQLKEFIIYDYSDNQPIDLSGNPIALFPSLMLNSGLGYSMNKLDAAIDFRHVGKQYLDNTENDDRTVDAYSLVGLSLSYPFTHFKSLQSLQLKLRINNLLDAEYETSGYYDPWTDENYYFVGAERNWFLTLLVSL